MQLIKRLTAGTWELSENKKEPWWRTLQPLTFSRSNPSLPAEQNRCHRPVYAGTVAVALFHKKYLYVINLFSSICMKRNIYFSNILAYSYRNIQGDPSNGLFCQHSGELAKATFLRLHNNPTSFIGWSFKLKWENKITPANLHTTYIQTVIVTIWLNKIAFFAGWSHQWNCCSNLQCVI